MTTIEVSKLTKTQARKITDRIAKNITDMWALVRQAHEGQAWVALGYSSWEEYVNTEFGISRGQSYRLLDQARIVAELESAAGLDPGDLSRARDTPIPSARQAAAIKPHLDDVAEKVTSATKGKRRESRPAIVAEVINQAATKPPAKTPSPPKVPESTIPRRRTPADTPTPEVLAVAVTKLVGFPPADAAGLDTLLFSRLQGWVRQAETARKGQASRASQPGRGRSQPKAKGSADGKCPHPPGRRLGNVCMACDATL